MVQTRVYAMAGPTKSLELASMRSKSTETSTKRRILDDVLENMQEAIESHLELMIEAGEAVPEPLD